MSQRSDWRPDEMLFAPKSCAGNIQGLFVHCPSWNASFHVHCAMPLLFDSCACSASILIARCALWQRKANR